MEDLKFNEILHDGIIYSVWVQEKDNKQFAHVYRGEEKMPCFGTSFGNMVSFKNDIMLWAKVKIEKQNNDNI